MFEFKSIIIPEGVIVIEEIAFLGCDKLETIFNASDVEVIVGDNYNCHVTSLTTQVYNKGEWNYVNGVATPNN